jgi:hypothetical protein
MRNRQEIETILKADLDLARLTYESARVEFSVVMSDIPSGLPQPDGTIRIRNAGALYNAAVQAYTEALREFNAFITEGVVPVRLNERAKKPPSETPA